MKWKPDVVVVQKDGYELRNEKDCMKVDEQDTYIVKAMESGKANNENLLRIIMKEEKTDDIVAGFRLAEFLVKYGKYIEELKGHKIIDM